LFIVIKINNKSIGGIVVSEELKDRSALVSKRKNKGVTQKQVAEDLGISRSFYGLIETGRRDPSLGLAMELAEYFDTTIVDLFFNDYWVKFLVNNRVTLN
jgi:putative transcriptional regulator